MTNLRPKTIRAPARLSFLSYFLYISYLLSFKRILIYKRNYQLFFFKFGARKGKNSSIFYTVIHKIENKYNIFFRLKIKMINLCNYNQSLFYIMCEDAKKEIFPFIAKSQGTKIKLAFFLVYAKKTPVSFDCCLTQETKKPQIHN